MHSALFTGWKVNTGLTFLFAPTSHTCVMSIIALPLSGTDKTTMGMGMSNNISSHVRDGGSII